MILQFVKILQFSKALILLVWTQFKPIWMQFKALIFFLGGSAPKNIAGGEGGSPFTDPPATFGSTNACFPNLALMAWIVIFWLTPCIWCVWSWLPSTPNNNIARKKWVMYLIFCMLIITSKFSASLSFLMVWPGMFKVINAISLYIK